MNYNVEFKGFGPQDGLESKTGIRKLIDDLVQRLEKKTKGLSPHVVFLRLLVERNPAHTL